MASDYAGEIWFQALSGVGQNISRVIDQKRKERQHLDAFDQFMQRAGQVNVAGGPLVNPKLIKMWSQQTREQKIKSEAAFETLVGIQANLVQNAALAKRRATAAPPFITDPDTGKRFYRGSRGYSPIPQTTSSDVQKAVSKYSASLGLTPDEFAQIDPTKLELYDQFGKAIDPKTPLQPSYASGQVGDKPFRIPFKDIQRFKNMVGIAKQTPQQGAGTGARRAVPQVGEVRKGYRFKGGNPADKNNWELVNGE